MRQLLVGLLIFVWHLLFAPAAKAQIDYYSPGKIYQFAEYLAAEGDYLRAAAEYERFYILTDSTPGGDSVIYKVARCYTLAGRPDRAVKYYQKIRDEYPGGLYNDAAAFGIARSYYQRAEYRRSLRAISDNPAHAAEYIARLANLTSINHLFLHRWQEAQMVLLPGENPVGQTDSLSIILGRLAREGAALPYKNKIIAGALSAVLPGMGKMYAGRFPDGLYSLLTVGLTGWQAYDGFKDGGVHSTKGWIYGALCGVFYLGNIYGSVVAVKIGNERLEANLLSRAGVLIETYFD